MGRYSDVFCKVYNEFGWNYYPEAFAEQLLLWLEEEGITVKRSMDLACGTGVLCEILHARGIAAAGMDFSPGMIDIARERNCSIPYDVADMITYRPEKQFDLVTCTGDALNHIMALPDVGRIFRNVHDYVAPGGYFVFDLLNEGEVSTDEPFDLDFSPTIRAQFQMLRLPDGRINLKTRVYENGEFTFEENIYEILHDPQRICAMLREAGFRHVTCRHTLRPASGCRSTTWYVIAQK